MLAPGADVSGLEVQRDGIGLPRDAWGVNAPIDPGAHVIEVRAPGHKARKLDVTVKPGGEHATVTIVALDLEVVAREASEPSRGAMAPAVLAAPAVPMTPGRTGRSAQWAIGWVVGGVGLAAAGTGITIAEVGQSQHETALGENCLPSAGAQCNVTKAHADDASADNTKLAGYVTIGVGGALLVAGVVLLLTAPSSHDAAPASALLVRPLFLPHGGGAGFATTW
jgi:hypothetical protein